MLRRHFGIGYHQARFVLPAWEVELLLNGLADELAGSHGDVDGPDVEEDEAPTPGRRFTLTTDDAEEVT